MTDILALPKAAAEPTTLGQAQQPQQQGFADCLAKASTDPPPGPEPPGGSNSSPRKVAKLQPNADSQDPDPRKTESGSPSGQQVTTQLTPKLAPTTLVTPALPILATDNIGMPADPQPPVSTPQLVPAPDVPTAGPILVAQTATVTTVPDAKVQAEKPKKASTSRIVDPNAGLPDKLTLNAPVQDAVISATQTAIAAAQTLSVPTIATVAPAAAAPTPIAHMPLEVLGITSTLAPLPPPTGDATAGAGSPDSSQTPDLVAVGKLQEAFPEIVSVKATDSGVAGPAPIAPKSTKGPQIQIDRSNSDKLQTTLVGAVDSPTDDGAQKVADVPVATDRTIDLPTSQLKNPVTPSIQFGLQPVVTNQTPVTPAAQVAVSHAQPAVPDPQGTASVPQETAPAATSSPDDSRAAVAAVQSTPIANNPKVQTVETDREAPIKSDSLGTAAPLRAAAANPSHAAVTPTGSNPIQSVQPSSPPTAMATTPVMPADMASSAAIDRAQLAQQVADHIQVLAASRPKDGVIVHLEPNNLGTVTLVVKAVANSVTAQIYASDDHVRDALDKSRTLLGSALATRGLSLNTVTVSSGSSSSGLHSGTQGQAQGQSSQAPWQQTQRSRPTVATLPDADKRQDRPTTTLMSSSAGLDVFI